VGHWTGRDVPSHATAVYLTLVGGRDGALVDRMPADFEPRVLEPRDFPTRPIRGGIIDHEHVEFVWPALRQNAGDALGDIRLGVVGLDEETDVHDG
jgi:hypothetical protein